jgi:NAD(P)H-hydrate epimerase
MVRDSKLLTARTVKDIDRKAQELLGISTLVLMENAGRAVAEEALKMMDSQRHVAIFCGKGNNGGDGFVAARHLLTCGYKPDIFLAGKISEVENEARINLEAILKLRQKIIEIEEDDLHSLANKILRYNLIIDALLGVGLRGQVRGVCRDLIEMINKTKSYILSVDVPSGLDATNGQILGCCIKANKTVTFMAAKRGMVLGKGPQVCGRIIVRDLGIPLRKNRLRQITLKCDF